METHEKHTTGQGHKAHYGKLLWMTALSFIIMYFLMYSMVDSSSNVIHNVNQIYMAALMTGAMILVEMLIMWKMYPDKKLNVLIASISGIVLILSFVFIRKQTAVGDKQFLKSMIPHHAAAILMVKETRLSDPEIQKLANDIISAQQREIEFMKNKLKQMDEQQ
jgi:uncharacterized protein (DUF305 family)